MLSKPDSSGTQILQLEQRQLYGSSRLGVITQEVRIAENASWPNVTPSYDTANAPFVLWNTDSTYLDSVFINPFDSVGYKIKVNKYLGYRNYELSNHLGNVLAVISDRKYGEDADTDGQLELFKPNVLPIHDTANAPFVLWNSDSTYQDSVFINPFDSVGYKLEG